MVGQYPTDCPMYLRLTFSKFPAGWSRIILVLSNAISNLQLVCLFAKSQLDTCVVLSLNRDHNAVNSEKERRKMRKRSTSERYKQR